MPVLGGRRPLGGVDPRGADERCLWFLTPQVANAAHADQAEDVAAVRASLTAALFVKLAFEFLVRTAARSGEVRGAEWAEIDTEEHVWTVPATRTKAKREHRVPLRRRAEQILDTLQTLGNGNPLVFPSRRGKRLTDVALSGVLKDLEIRHLHADVLQHSADGLDAPLAVGNPRRRRRGGAATRRPTPQGSAKGGDEVRRQVADEPHGVGNDDLALARESQAPRSGVEGREHLVGDVHLGARQGPQHRALARLRIADDGQNRDRAAPPSLPPFLRCAASFFTSRSNRARRSLGTPAVDL